MNSSAFGLDQIGIIAKLSKFWRAVIVILKIADYRHGRPDDDAL